MHLFMAGREAACSLRECKKNYFLTLKLALALSS